jgi:malonyl-CoA/methylmalonyl-CoA synthetase
VFAGYWRDPERTRAEFTADGWFKPGTAMSEADIINALQARLARYKIPKRVLFVEELPRNAMGKVQKNALRTAYAALYAPK